MHPVTHPSCNAACLVRAYVQCPPRLGSLSTQLDVRRYVVFFSVFSGHGVHMKASGDILSVFLLLKVDL